MLCFLLKRQLYEKLSIFKKDKKNIDYLGIILSLMLVALIIYIIVEVFSQFVIKYSAIRINNVKDTDARQFELMTIIYEVLLILGVISSVNRINYAIFENDDRNILITLPIKSSTIFYSKLIGIYLKQGFIALFAILPFNLTFAVATTQSTYFIVMSVVSCLVFPIIIISVASVFCLPFFYFKRAIQSKYLLMLIIITILLGVFFSGYKEIIDFINALMTTGEIKFFFSEKTMNNIILTTKYLYPANLMANILLKSEVGKNIGILSAMLVCVGLAGYFIIKALYTKATKLRAVSDADYLPHFNKSMKQKPIMLTLLEKEFKTVLRTPNYAIQYFSVAALMPLLVYFCMEIGSGLLMNMVFINKNLELAIFLVILFGALTNTFSATNVSRDGNAFCNVKSMPVKCEQVVGAKVIFSLIITAVSVAISCIVLTAKSYLTISEGFFVFLIGLILGTAQICFATRIDLNHPKFSIDDDNEVRESNTNISVIILFGFIVALILGVIPLYKSIYNGLNGTNTTYFTYIFDSLVSIIILAISFIYLMFGLKKKFLCVTEIS